MLLVISNKVLHVSPQFFCHYYIYALLRIPFKNVPDHWLYNRNLFKTAVIYTTATEQVRLDLKHRNVFWQQLKSHFNYTLKSCWSTGNLTLNSRCPSLNVSCFSLTTSLKMRKYLGTFDTENHAVPCNSLWPRTIRSMQLTNLKVNHISEGKRSHFDAVIYIYGELK